MKEQDQQALACVIAIALDASRQLLASALNTVDVLTKEQPDRFENTEVKLTMLKMSLATLASAYDLIQATSDPAVFAVVKARVFGDAGVASPSRVDPLTLN